MLSFAHKLSAPYEETNYFYLCGLLAWPAFAQQIKPQFDHLTTSEGLSQSHVDAILKDSKGFMWFGTDEGLNKYDGYKFSIYKHSPEVSSSLANNFVQDIVEDEAGALWIATRDGLDKFDRSSDTFTHTLKRINIRRIVQDTKQHLWLATTSGLYYYNCINGSAVVFKHDSTNRNSLSDNTVNQIAKDKYGNIWVATQHGLTKLTLKTNRAERYYHNAASKNSIGSNIVRCVLSDSEKNIWVGMTGGGIARYNESTNSFDNFLHDDKNPASIGYDDVLTIMESAKGTLWIGTENGGVSILKTKTGLFTTFKNDSFDDKSLSNNSIYCMYKDDIGGIWVGTYSGGINFMSASGRKFNVYRNRLNHNSLSHNIVLSIKGDADGNVWLGTDGGGLNQFDPKTQQFTVYKNQPMLPNSPKSDYIISLAALDGNTLALGYHRNGFDLFDSRKKTFWHYVPASDNQTALPQLSINSLAGDKKNNLWIGTWMQGLFFFDRLSKRVTRYTHNTNQLNSLSDNSINAIYEDSDGLIWIGTENGLDVFDKERNIFTHYKHNDKDNSSLASNTVQSLLARNDGTIWVGTAGGLCLFDKRSGKFSTISETDGLANNVINSLVSDGKGKLWMSTNRGISRYNPVTKGIRNYDISDGLQGSEFKVGSVYKAPGGELYFGGINGFNEFHPDSVHDNTYIPPVYLTDFQIFNKSVSVGAPASPLTAHISMTKLITLTYGQGVFSFEFAALNYTLPQKNQYAYKLEGFDKEWNYVGNKRTATYTNLDPADYIFRVKGANNDGIWNEKGVAVTIRVLPPYWETWWFRTLAMLLIAGAAYLFYKGRIKTIQAQKWALERIVEERTERLHQEQVLNKMKSQFVSTASHEFRTPLATIQSSIDLVDMYLAFPAENGKPLIQKHLRIVEKEIGKFGNLLDDVLTIEKMNAGKVGFAPRPVDFLAICDDIIATHFQTRKDQRCVDVLVIGPPRPVLLDEKLIRHALVNLLSNAFKFSPTNPRLTVIFEADRLMLTVSDDGIGIPDHDVSHLFETFFRAGNVSTIQGTGLGLFITKQSVERHGGTIGVQSLENEGTTFTITIPA